MKTPIVIVAFGAMSKEARHVYHLLETHIQQAFPEASIHWAYTAKSLVARLKAQGEAADTLPEAVAKLMAVGHRQGQLMSLHLVPGEKHQEIVSDVPPGFSAILTAPLLHDASSIAHVAQAMLQEMPLDRPVLVVAHGNEHHAHYNGELLALKAHLQAQRPDLHLALLEGDPCEEALEDFIQVAKRANKVHVYPFLFLAGDHVQNDILGEEPDSFKSRLGVADFTCAAPLGQKPWVREAFLQRLQALAVNR